MEHWTSAKIRKTFLDFYASKQHEIVPSAPMVVKDDPTLMFTNAGMNQFKDYFLGNKKAANTRVSDSQKCLRVSGKHNDLEEVGKDTYHHTMFEMLGNWSFGDYFKEEAISWAWELLTDVYKLDKDRLYVSIFSGDKNDGLELDKESSDIWKKFISEDKILAFDRKDNFWEMGDVGPCGPCSEIHVDLRSDAERKAVDGKTLVNEDHPLVVEIWNLVFIQYNRQANGELKPLPSKHVDTGMGFERLAMALQAKQSNYDTDVFQPLIQKISKIAGVVYGATMSEKDISIRVIADHIRAISFSIADGQLLSNTGAGYVIRRILRRAVRYGYSFLGLREPFMFELVDVLVAQMGEQFPELKSQQDLITKVVTEEEESFLRTLDKGIKRFEEYANICSTKEVDGKFAFELYDTFGFPIDLTSLLAEEKNLTVDMNSFQTYLEEQKNRSRKATEVITDDWVEILQDEREEFIGYDRTEATIHITRYRKVQQKGKELYQLVFSYTPFYAEGGGQVGDRGTISNENETIHIIDTKKENNLIIHFADGLPVNPKADFVAKVNSEDRTLTESNHSATHLLHEALREVLGTHVEQRGSLVNEKHMRFDFSHFQKVSEEEIAKIETLVNKRITANIPLIEKRTIPIDEAKDMGAMALFGEKYGDLVRVIQFGTSVELCGGTHVDSTAKIGLFKITHEGSVASGIRRIEAITNSTAFSYVDTKIKQLNAVSDLLKHPKDALVAIQQLMDKNAELTKKIDQLNKEKAKGAGDELLKTAEEVNGLRFIATELDLESNAIKDLAFDMKDKVDNLFMVIGSKANGKATLTVALSNEVVVNKGLNAGAIIRDLAKEIQGGGGGQPTYATAGGKNPAGLLVAFEKAKSLLS